MKTLYFEGAGWSGADSSKNTIGNCRIRTAFHLDNGHAVYLEIICGTRTLKKTRTRSIKPDYYGYVDSLFYITDDKDNNDCNKHNLLCGRRVEFDYTNEAILSFVNSLGVSFKSVMVLPDLGGYRVFKDSYSRKGTERYNYGDEFQFDPEMTVRREEIYKKVYEIEREEGKKYPNFSLWVDQDDSGLLHLLRHFNGHNKHWNIRTDVGETISDWMNSATEAPLGCYGF